MPRSRDKIYLHLLTSRRYEGKLLRLGFGSGISGTLFVHFFRTLFFVHFSGFPTPISLFVSEQRDKRFMMECDDTDFYQMFTLSIHTRNQNRTESYSLLQQLSCTCDILTTRWLKVVISGQKWPLVSVDQVK